MRLIITSEGQHSRSGSPQERPHTEAVRPAIQREVKRALGRSCVGKGSVRARCQADEPVMPRWTEGHSFDRASD